MNITIKKAELSRLVEDSVRKHLSDIGNDPDAGLELSRKTLERMKKYENSSRHKGISLLELRKKYG